jgi:hypothetical protein
LQRGSTAEEFFMKSQLTLNRVGSCIWFVVVALALSISGCVTQKLQPIVLIPFTTNINKAYLPTDNTIGWQLYISQPFTLIHAGGASEERREDGRGRMIGTTGIETIKIEAYTMGVLRNPDDRNPYDPPGTLPNTLNIAFDNYEGSPTISFTNSKEGIDPNARYEIVFSDPENTKITYRGEQYIIVYSNKIEPPFLMVRIDYETTANDTKWEMTGVSVNEH